MQDETPLFEQVRDETPLFEQQRLGRLAHGTSVNSLIFFKYTIASISLQCLCFYFKLS